MRTRLLDETDAERYRSFVNDSPHTSVYHTLEWLTLLGETFGYRPYHLLAEADGEIRGVLPLFLVSSWFKGKNLIGLPFSHTAGLACDDDSSEEVLIREADRLADRLGAGYVEIRQTVNAATAKDLDLERRQLNHESTLGLNGSIDQVWQKLDNESVRWGVRRARRSGVEVRRGETLADFKIFYELEAETRKRQGVPLYPFSLFRNLFELLLPQGQCRLYLALVEGVPIGGVVMLYHRDEAIYGYGATQGSRENLRLRPMNILLWRAIEDAHDMGILSFNFGSTPLSNKGLLAFKKQWATETSLLTYSYLLKRRRRLQTIEREGWKVHLASWILKRFPLSITKAVGPLLVRHLG